MTPDRRQSQRWSCILTSSGKMICQVFDAKIHDLEWDAETGTLVVTTENGVHRILPPEA